MAETQQMDQSQIAQEIANTRPDDLVRPEALNEIGSSPSFSVIANLFEHFTANKAEPGKKKPTNKNIAEKRKDWINSTFDVYRKNVGLDLFPVVRLLVPDRDRQRNTYGAKEQVLAKAYVGAMGLLRDTMAAQRLLHWKQPRKNEPGAGDFAEVVMQEVKSRSDVAKGKLSIEQVNSHLDQLARASNEAERIRIVRVFYENLTALENKWLVRIILKDLKISIRERTVLAVLHPDAMDLFNVCSDLRRVCWTLYDPNYRLPHEDSTVKIFMSFRPMLCKRNDNDKRSVVKSMNGHGNDVTTDGFIMEEKLDGERIQLHKRGEEFRYYSRKDKDYTYLYGKSREEGSLTPYVHSLIHSDIEEIVLDGEMLAYDPLSQTIQPFGSLKTAALDKSTDPNKPRPVFKVFDVLYAKGKKQAIGQTLITKKLSARKEFVRRFTKQSVGRLEWADMRYGKNEADIEGYFQEIMERFGEGLVIKNSKSPYVLNGREDSWIKVKPEYTDELGENFELVVIGGFWGSGKRGGYFGSFFCGIRDDKKNEPLRFLSFCKVGSGLTMDYLDHIRETTAGKWRPFPKDKRNPPNLHFGAEKPDEWIAPEDSFFLGVKAAEIVNDAKNYGAGLCLRFPRIQWLDKERTHKLEDCMDLSEFLVRKDGIGKRKAEGDEPRHGKKKKFKREPAVTTYAEAFRGADVEGVEIESRIFDGMMFWVLEGSKEPGETKNDLERIVYTHGGDYCQKVPDANDRSIICNRTDFLTVQTTMNRGESIISTRWIIDCVAKERRIPFSDEYYTFKADEVLISPAREKKALPKSVKKVKKEKKEESDEEMDRKPLASTLKDKGKFREVENVESEAEDDEKDASQTESETEDEKTQDEDPDSHDDEPASSRLTGFAKNSGPGLAAGIANADYGQDKHELFNHLFFYLDTQENGVANNLRTASNTRGINDEPWSTVQTDLVEAGGHLVGIKDGRLTHVIIWPGDTTRSKQLYHLTTKEPRYKQFVTTAWVTDSVSCERLMLENEFRPTA